MKKFKECIACGDHFRVEISKSEIGKKLEEAEICTLFCVRQLGLEVSIENSTIRYQRKTLTNNKINSFKVYDLNFKRAIELCREVNELESR